MAINVFISYSHKDENYKDDLETHLKIHERNGLIFSWHDRKINASQDWSFEIDNALQNSQLILLLISPDFIASDYCYEKEMMEAIKMHKSNKAKVIPLILRPCNFTNTPFAKLQALPKNAKPISLWENKDEAYLDISRGIEKLIKPKLKNTENGVSEIIVELINKPKKIDIVIFITTILSAGYLTFWVISGLDTQLNLPIIFWDIELAFLIISFILIFYLLYKCVKVRFRESLNLYSLIFCFITILFSFISRI
ncbi:MAG: toll/interleukin-1 receptor domain-containing protein [Chitinophagaceae bacterium]